MNKIINANECKNIDEIRQQIDLLDNTILELFAKRKEYVNKIVDFKHSESDIVAEQRQANVLSKIKKIAQKNGLNPEVYQTIYQTLINYNIQEELKLFKAQSNK